MTETRTIGDMENENSVDSRHSCLKWQPSYIFQLPVEVFGHILSYNVGAVGSLSGTNQRLFQILRQDIVWSVLLQGCGYKPDIVHPNSSVMMKPTRIKFRGVVFVVNAVFQTELLLGEAGIRGIFYDEQDARDTALFYTYRAMKDVQAVEISEEDFRDKFVTWLTTGKHPWPPNPARGLGIELAMEYTVTPLVWEGPVETPKDVFRMQHCVHVLYEVKEACFGRDGQFLPVKLYLRENDAQCQVSLLYCADLFGELDESIYPRPVSEFRCMRGSVQSSAAPAVKHFTSALKNPTREAEK